MYTQSITRTHRTAFILLIDGSGSMNEEILFHGKRMTKAEAVASITNGMLFELVERARRSDGVRDYYDISVLTYSGDNEVYSLLPEGREMLSVAELAAGEIPMKRELVEYRMPDGSTSLRELPVPDWIAAEAAGQTPMYQALDHAYEIAEAWCRNPAHAESFPPTVFNITDGDPTSRSTPSSSPQRRRPPTPTAMPGCSTTVRVRCPKSSTRQSAKPKAPGRCHRSAA